MTGRRALATAVAGCVVAGLVLVFAAGRPWAVLHLHTGAGAGAGQQSHGTSGRTITPVPYAMGWVAAAAGVALLAARRWGRVAIGVVLVLAGIAAAVDSARHASDTGIAAGWYAYTPVTSVTRTNTAWPYVAIVAGVGLLALGGWVVARGRSWPGMGERYDAPGGPPRPRDDATAAWDALDRGEDPTAH